MQIIRYISGINIKNKSIYNTSEKNDRNNSIKIIEKTCI